MRSLLVMLVLAGCSLDYTPDVGGLEATNDGGVGGDGATPHLGCTNADSDTSVDVSFSKDVRPLMWRTPGGCNCHLQRVTSGLDLSSYASMRRGGLNSGTRIIIAGQPCDSILPMKLSRTPPFGSRMPFNGPPYFTDAELQLVRDWIAEGALDN